MRLGEHVPDRRSHRDRHLGQRGAQHPQNVTREGIDLDLVHPLPKFFRSIIESVEDHILESEAGELSDRAEFGGSKGDVGDEGERWVFRQKLGDGGDVHYAVGEGIENDYADGFPTDEAIKLIPCRGDQEFGLFGEHLLDVGEQPRGQKGRYAQGAVARVTYGKWGVLRSGARGNDKKSALFDTE